MENINIAELLKECPKGMELDYALFEDTIFIGVEENKNYPILIKLKDGSQKRLTKYGCHSNADYAKCVIFPKGKTTWEGFQRPFKDGDVLYVDCTDEGDDSQCDFIFILNEVYNGEVHSYCHYYIPDDGFQFRELGTEYLTDDEYPIRFATEEEKEKLFDAIKANGYKWNAETKTLEKLVPNKFDITTLKPFDKVLYRMHNNDTWLAGFYNVCIKNKIFIIGLEAIPYCIPYEGNQHLLGTTNDCDDFYKTWEK